MSWLQGLPPTSRPHWLCYDLHLYMESTAREYISLEEAAVSRGSWISSDRDPDYDLGLDMAYSRLRTSVNRVKYGRIENRRHTEELARYYRWLQENRARLKVTILTLFKTLVLPESAT